MYKNHLLHLIHKKVSSQPDQLALVQDGEQITYQELRDHAKDIAGLLYSQEKLLNQGVALHMEKSIGYIKSILGCRMAGTYFIPIHTGLPEKRKKYILSHSQTNICLFDKNNIPESSIKQLSIQETKHHQGKISFTAQKEAYLIYTSGSTGTPKGVLVNHSGLSNVIKEQVQEFGITPLSRSLLLLSINFDASLSDIFTILTGGGTLYLPSPETGSIYSKLPNLIRKWHITILDIPPSLLRLLTIDQVGPTLQTIIVGGEVPDKKMIHYRSKFAKVINVYGPTEATICTSICHCNGMWDVPDIGKPINNCSYEIFDGKNIIKGNATGELLIGGASISTTYFNNNLLQQKKYISIQGKKWYKTGDIVERLGERYIYKGRTDRQIKIHGQLVCPEEIENTLRNHPLVKEAAIICETKKTGNKIKAAIFHNPGFNQGTFKEEISQLLPQWMIPHELHFFTKALPKNQNGKICRERIKKNFARENTKETPHSPHMNKIEETLLEVWKKILPTKSIGIHDDFFEVGGDSLTAIEMIILMKTKGYIISPEHISQNKTISLIASQINKKDLGISFSQLKEKIIFPELSQKHRTPQKKLHQKKWFLTGSTGFLGIWTTYNLLTQTGDTIYVLSRKEKKQTLKKLKKQLEKYHLQRDSSLDDRIIYIKGDITKKNLGISDTDYSFITNNITDIVHMAAEVNMFKNYAELYQSNIYPIYQILNITQQGLQKNIHYASSLSVFVGTDNTSQTAYEKEIESGDYYIYGGYAQTKIVAEEILNYASSYINTGIYRFGLLTGDTTYGTSPTHDFLGDVLKGILDHNKLPLGSYFSLLVDITPIDFASKVFCKGILKGATGYFHISSGKTFSLQQIFDNIKYTLNNEVEILEEKERKKSFFNVHDNQTLNQSRLGLCRLEPTLFKQRKSMDLFQASNIVFDRKNTLTLVGNIKSIEVNNNLLRLYLSKLHEKDQ